MEKLKVGVVGLGGRGYGMMCNLLDMEDIQVVAVCDLYPDRLENGAVKVMEYSDRPATYCDYNELVKDENVQAVFVFTAWEAHIKICVAAMKAKKRVAMEVGGATSIDECYWLVRTSEETGIPCMFLENCCYGRTEMTLLNMIKQELFGEIIHCKGGYLHDLRHEICMGMENRHYRLNNYINRNGENYASHELGPISKYLNINRTNRMLSLTSMASKSRGLSNWVRDNKSEDTKLLNTTFNQGDIVTTMIKCANGETIILTLDTSLPRPYSRGGHLQGTKGVWQEDNNSIYFDKPTTDTGEMHSWEDFSPYLDKYEHPLWTKYRNDGVKGGHDGMDYLVLRAFIESVKNNTNPPIDVYDAATWMAITCLSEQSIALGSMPVAIPDFTNGKWIDREPKTDSLYCLD